MTIQFHDIDGTWVMRIAAGRRIEVNENFEVTEVAKKVLESMQNLLDAQPEREWVGLTHEERLEIVEANTTDDHGYDIWCDGDDVARAIEAKLREKNT